MDIILGTSEKRYELGIKMSNPPRSLYLNFEKFFHYFVYLLSIVDPVPLSLSVSGSCSCPCFCFGGIIITVAVAVGVSGAS